MQLLRNLEPIYICSLRAVPWHCDIYSEGQTHLSASSRAFAQTKNVTSQVFFQIKYWNVLTGRCSGETEQEEKETYLVRGF